MKLNRLSITQFKNIAEANMHFSPKLNCFIGANGMGKTNLLEAIYMLSFTKGLMGSTDTPSIRHGEDFAVVKGVYSLSENEEEQDIQDEIYCGLSYGRKKTFKRNQKSYKRIAEHIGLIPLVMISPADSTLIAGGSDVRRRFMDMVISQFDSEYLYALQHYNKALQQRNVMLKMEHAVLDEILETYEEVMAKHAANIYAKRKDFLRDFIPIFQRYYSVITGGEEQVCLTYESHQSQGSLVDLLRASRPKERILGYSIRGIHKDDLIMELEGYPIKVEGSQGQNKTYLVAMKLAQFEWLKIHTKHTPILLLDDLFDKLDAHRVTRLMDLLKEDRFGQIFITDTNREHLDRILDGIYKNHKIFMVQDGMFAE
ncbi:MAG TPA: DNA replication and repair protein RecF [Bacteroidaceae bacterium]|nr:DNA replication and repair protein RecF [Bacteroidaceae bacterium]